MSAQKLALIDPQLLKDLIFMAKERNNISKPCNPPDDPYLKSMCENQATMENVLDNPSMSDEKKVLLYNQALDRFRTMNKKQSSVPYHQEEVEEPEELEEEAPDLSKDADALQWSNYSGTKKIYKYLKANGMTVNPAGEVVLKGTPIKGSNFKTLIDEFGATRKKLKADVVGLKPLMDFIISENLDKSYIQSPAVRAHFIKESPKSKGIKRRRATVDEFPEDSEVFYDTDQDTEQEGQGLKWFRF